MTISISPEQIQAASDLLWDHWQQGTRLDAVPERIRPATREQGYAVQAQLEARTRHPLFGWKIAATSKAGQKHINVDGPLAGRLLRERVRDDGGEIPFGRNHMRVAEAEFAFRMGRDIAPRGTSYEVDEVLDAVATLHPAIEVPDSRFNDFTVVGAPQLIADNACAHYFTLGPPAPDAWRRIDLSRHGVVGRIAGRLERNGVGSNVLGDPRVALTWLANELSLLGITLRSGQVVTTGTCLIPLEIEPGAHVQADFGSLGSVHVHIGA